MAATADCSAGVALAFAFLRAEVGLAYADEPTPASDVPQRLKRSESFFGVHFDFHAGKGTPNIGATTTPEMVQAIIDSLHPDFIQVDSKGHPGLTSYPTKVGNPAPGVVADSLKIWREVTARNGVALYTHYSGVWDNEAVALHPEWAVTYSDGSRSKEKTSVFGDYAAKLLIPQILEKALVYGTDGVWIDGECWATELDYSEKAKEAFKAQTGIENIPTGPGQEGWLEWRSFHQEAFRQYLRNYVDAIKSKAPNFQVASNWAFTDHMPDPVSANVNFISGDYLVCSFLDFWIIIEYLEHFLIANGFTINIVPLMPLFNCLFISFIIDHACLVLPACVAQMRVQVQVFQRLILHQQVCHQFWRASHRVFTFVKEVFCFDKFLPSHVGLAVELVSLVAECQFGSYTFLQTSIEIGAYKNFIDNHVFVAVVEQIQLTCQSFQHILRDERSL